MQLEKYIGELEAKVAALEAANRALTETAAEQNRVHIEMHNDLVVQDELIQKQGRQIKDYLDAAVKAEVRVAELERENSVLRGEHATNAEVFNRYREALEVIRDGRSLKMPCDVAREALHPTI